MVFTICSWTHTGGTSPLPLPMWAWHYPVSLQHACGSPSLLGNKYRVKQVGQPTSVVLGAKRKASDLLRTQISMSWSFPTITSFTRLATKEKEKVVWELKAKDVILNPITFNSGYLFLSHAALALEKLLGIQLAKGTTGETAGGSALCTWLSGRLRRGGEGAGSSRMNRVFSGSESKGRHSRPLEQHEWKHVGKENMKYCSVAWGEGIGEKSEEKWD